MKASTSSVCVRYASGIRNELQSAALQSQRRDWAAMPPTYMTTNPGNDSCSCRNSRVWRYGGQSLPRICKRMAEEERGKDLHFSCVPGARVFPYDATPILVEDKKYAQEAQKQGSLMGLSSNPMFGAQSTGRGWPKQEPLAISIAPPAPGGDGRGDPQA
jgi:hypothetical protein